MGRDCSGKRLTPGSNGGPVEPGVSLTSRRRFVALLEARAPSRRLCTAFYAGAEGFSPKPAGGGQSVARTWILRAFVTSALGRATNNSPSCILASIFEPSTVSGRKNRRLKEP